MLVTEQISYIFCFGFEHLNAWDFFFLIWGFSLRRYLFYLSFEKKKTTNNWGLCDENRYALFICVPFLIRQFTLMDFVIYLALPFLPLLRSLSCFLNVHHENKQKPWGHAFLTIISSKGCNKIVSLSVSVRRAAL